MKKLLPLKVYPHTFTNLDNTNILGDSFMLCENNEYIYFINITPEKVKKYFSKKTRVVTPQ